MFFWINGKEFILGVELRFLKGFATVFEEDIRFQILQAGAEIVLANMAIFVDIYQMGNVLQLL